MFILLKNHVKFLFCQPIPLLIIEITTIPLNIQTLSSKSKKMRISTQFGLYKLFIVLIIPKSEKLTPPLAFMTVKLGLHEMLKSLALNFHLFLSLNKVSYLWRVLVLNNSNMITNPTGTF